MTQNSTLNLLCFLHKSFLGKHLFFGTACQRDGPRAVEPLSPLMGAPESVEEKEEMHGALFNDKLMYTFGPESDFIKLLNETLKKKQKPPPEPPSGHEWSDRLEEVSECTNMLPQLRTLNVLWSSSTFG